MLDIGWFGRALVDGGLGVLARVQHAQLHVRTHPVPLGVPQRRGRAATYRPISVYRLGEIPTQSCGQSLSAPRGKAGARLNAHTELRAERQRSTREGIYRKQRIDRHVIGCQLTQERNFQNACR
jgi:hypothetical protein